MNRQVIPSMLLSVFIVCFFSVLLYDQDKPSAAADSPRAEAKAEPVPAASESLAASEPASPALPAPEVADAKASASKPAEPAETRAQADPTPPSPAESTAAAESKAAEPAAATSPVDPATRSPGEPATPVSAPAPAPVPLESVPRREPPKTTIPAASEAPHEPRSAFTTSRDGESLADVAVRVYGTADKTETLWKANRDLLPHRNSPLSGGALLRTPAE